MMKRNGVEARPVLPPSRSPGAANLLIEEVFLPFPNLPPHLPLPFLHFLFPPQLLPLLLEALSFSLVPTLLHK